MSSVGRKRCLNEAIFTKAVKRDVEAEAYPYLLCAAINIDPTQSDAIRTAVDNGLLIDVGHMCATEVCEGEGESVKIPDNTFFAQGPTPGIKEKSATRTDVILANPAAAAAILRFVPRWDLVEEARAPLQNDLVLAALEECEVVQRTRGTIKCTIDEQVDMDQAYRDVRALYEQTLEDHLQQHDLNGVHETWNKIAEISIDYGGGGEPLIGATRG